MKAPLVHGDDDSEPNIGVIDSRQPGETLTGGMIPPAANSATLTQRLSKKLSAIPAYLQTPDDPESLRLTSAEPSGSSLSGYGPHLDQTLPPVLLCPLLPPIGTLPTRLMPTDTSLLV